jgi:hypothetical protein
MGYKARVFLGLAILSVDVLEGVSGAIAQHMSTVVGVSSVGTVTRRWFCYRASNKAFEVIPIHIPAPVSLNASYFPDKHSPQSLIVGHAHADGCLCKGYLV